MDGFDEGINHNDDNFFDFLAGFERISQQGRLEQHPTVRTSILHIKVDSIESPKPCMDSSRLMSCIYCEVSVVDDVQINKCSRASRNKSVHILQPHAVDVRDNIWELLEYYGPTPVKFRIIERGLFHSSEIASGCVHLGTLMSHQDRIYKARKATSQQAQNNDPLGAGGGDASSTEGNIPAIWGFEHELCLNESLSHAEANKKSYSSADGNNGNDKCASSSFESKFKILEAADPSDVGGGSHAVGAWLPDYKIKFRFRLINVASCCRLDPVLCVSAKGLGRSNSELHVAVENGCVTLVTQLLTILAQNSVLKQALALKNSNYYNAFGIALMTKNKEMVKLLLKRCGIWCFQDTGQMQSCALHWAVEGGCAECLSITLRFLKRYTADIVGWSISFTDMLEWKDPMANTPLAVACTKSDVNIVKILQRAGASVDIPNRVTQRTVFMYACESGNVQTVEYLLSIVKSKRELRLERARAPSSASTTQGGAAAATGNAQAADARTLPKASLLSTLKCRPAEKDASGITALMLAAEGGHLSIVQTLLRLDVSLLSTSFSGNGIFHFACASGRRDVVELLVQYEKQQWLDYKKLIREKSLLQSMCHRPKAMLTRNHRGQQPHQIAAEKGFTELAECVLATAKKIYADHKSVEMQAGNTDWENIDSYQGEHLDDQDYDFSIAPKASGPNNYYATLAIMHETEQQNGENSKAAAPPAAPSSTSAVIGRIAKDEDGNNAKSATITTVAAAPVPASAAAPTETPSSPAVVVASAAEPTAANDTAPAAAPVTAGAAGQPEAEETAAKVVPAAPIAPHPEQPVASVASHIMPPENAAVEETSCKERGGDVIPPPTVHIGKILEEG